MTRSLDSRLVRYVDLVPCTTAFVDTRTPGSDRKENFTIIGPGVAENPHQHVHLREPHGFNIGGARQPGGCLNSQHSHETAEVFVVHTGRWRFLFGVEAGCDGHLDAGPGDVVSVPTRMFRGFAKLDPEVGFLWVVLGGDDPGKVTWAPKVFELAERYGLVLLEGGRLVDTTLGETVPEGARRQAPPDEATLRALSTPPLEELARCVLRAGEMRPFPGSPLAGPGVGECPVIGPRPSRDGFPAGPITGWWPHGFVLRRLDLEPGAVVPPHRRQEPEVLFVHEGALEVRTPLGSVVMAPGDSFSTPGGLERSFRGLASTGTRVFVVRGGEEAGEVVFAERRAA